VRHPVAKVRTVGSWRRNFHKQISGDKRASTKPGTPKQTCVIVLGIAEDACVQRGGEAGETAKGESRVTQLAAFGIKIARQSYYHLRQHLRHPGRHLMRPPACNARARRSGAPHSSQILQRRNAHARRLLPL